MHIRIYFFVNNRDNCHLIHSYNLMQVLDSDLKCQAAFGCISMFAASALRCTVVTVSAFCGRFPIHGMRITSSRKRNVTSGIDRSKRSSSQSSFRCEITKVIPRVTLSIEINCNPVFVRRVSCVVLCKQVQALNEWCGT